MTFAKALLAGFAGFSMCMADISGTVTDTGTTPVAGAVVRLEIGGQTATTKADGSFTLAATAILPGNDKLLQNSLFAAITGTIMTVTIAERSAVEVTTFNLSGKALSIVRKTLDAGSHSLSLPYRGAGIYLYKVKSGNGEFVTRGNAYDGIAYGSAVLSQGSIPNSPAKQAKVTAAISDVIAATKTGYLNYHCGIGNSDTSGIAIKMIANAGDITDADGNVYQTVSIGNQVWTVDNLRTTKYNDGSAIPLDESASTWYDTISKNCYYENTANADSINKFGALYTWYAVNTGKLAPAGWHVPTDAEWDTLQNCLIAKGYNWDGTTTENKIAKSLSAKTDWLPYPYTGSVGCDPTQNDRSGFSALPGGYRDFRGTFSYRGDHGFWWSASERINAWMRSLGRDSRDLGRDRYGKSCGFSIRLVRD
jgi:uncharacterized protein (TIGR02145 family)